MRKIFTLIAAATLAVASMWADGDNSTTTTQVIDLSQALPTALNAGVTTVTLTGDMADVNIADLRTLCNTVTTFHMQGCTATADQAAQLLANNTTVKNVILPPSFATAAIPEAIYTGCTQLNAMAAAAVGATSTVTDFSAHVATAGSLFTEVATPTALPALWTDSNSLITASNITATGTLNEYDVHKQNNGTIDYNTMIGKDIVHLDIGGATLQSHGDDNHQGHFILGNTMQWVSLPEGITKISPSDAQTDGALTFISLPTTLQKIESQTFSNCSNNLTGIEFRETGTEEWGLEIGPSAFPNNKGLTSVTFPARLTKIGDGAFNSAEKLHSITFTGNRLTEIGSNAFNNTDLYAINLPDGLQKIGAGAFQSKTQNKVFDVLMIPATVTEIGSTAFNNLWIRDVYFLGTTCPVVGGQAFSPGSTHGSGNLNANEIYVVNKNGEIEVDANGNYVVQELVRTWTDDDGTVHTNEKPYKEYWEKQAGADLDAIFAIAKKCGDHFTTSHGAYSYHDAAEGKDKYTSVLHLNPDLLLADNADELAKFTDPSRRYHLEDRDLGENYHWPTRLEMENAYNIANGNHTNQDGSTFTVPTNTDITNAMSLHEFTLVTFDAPRKKPSEPWEFDFGNEGGKWWTICVPFNMKKSQVKEVFGAETSVCRFNKVVRREETQTDGTKKWVLKLCFTHEVCLEDRDGRDATTSTAVGDDDIVIHAHMPYMIHPSADPEGEGVDRIYRFSGWDIIKDVPQRDVVEANEGMTGEEHPEYAFYGSYQGGGLNVGDNDTKSDKMPVPQYSYVLAISHKGTPEEKRSLKFNKRTDLAFKPYGAIVRAVKKQTADRDTFFPDAASGNAKAGTCATVFGDDEQGVAQQVDKVEIVCGAKSEAVYTLAGQRLTALPSAPGMYIVGGRKVVVK